MQNSGLQILGLTLGHVPNPVGILEPQMQFAWKGESDKPNATQTAYRIGRAAGVAQTTTPPTTPAPWRPCSAKASRWTGKWRKPWPILPWWVIMSLA